MKVIGLAGRAGSGKSVVSRYLAQQPGVEWIDLDRVAWGTYAMGTPVHERLLRAFGRSILSDSGEINRPRLANAAFASQENQEMLNAIVHPAVSVAVAEIIANHRREGTELLLIEGALLASSPHVDRSNYDLIVWLDVPDDVRAERLQAVGRVDHAGRGDNISLTGDVVMIPAIDSVEGVANRVLEAIAEESG